MYVYIQSERHLWSVGFYDPGGRWVPESDHGSSEDAADRVHWLNGGEKDDDVSPYQAAMIIEKAKRFS